MPRAEMPPEERDRMLAKFLAAYNERHGTNYVFTEEEPPSDPSCDYLCRDPGRPNTPLKIQHTDAWTEPEGERIRPRFVEEYIVRRLRAELRARGISGYYISLAIDNRPANKQAAETFFQDLLQVIEFATMPSGLVPPGQLVMEFDRRDIRTLYEPISPYLSSLQVFRLTDPSRLTFGFSPTNPDEGVVDPASRVVNALNPKDDRLGPSAADLVLLIRCTALPFDESLDTPEVRRQLLDRKLNFREVWVVNDFEEPISPFASRIWP